MKLYVEISGEKHYIDEGIVEKYALYEGYVAPFTGLKIKKEDDTKVVAVEIKETETPLPAAIVDSETSTDITEINEIDDSDDSIDVVVETTPEFTSVSDESLTDAKETNEALSKSEDMDVNESATLVSD
jgi:glyceraldehyde-3-phosphate dehydrogenase/erythrose-4-phosphate dehydrogenase